MKTREKRFRADDWDIEDDDIEGFREWDLEAKLNSDKYCSKLIKRFQNAENFDLRFFQKFGFSVPLFFHDKAGLGIKMPREGFTVDDIKKCVGARRLVDVVDVRTQKALTMTMRDWCKYYNNPNKDRLLNVISLEFSHTKLGSYIDAPSVVRQLDWVWRVWPSYLRDLQKESTNDLSVMKYPKVSKYALMSVKGCYTDFHVDFGGTSVWYHIFRGEKVFWMVPPTEVNLQVFEQWSLSGKQGEIFFPDLVPDCECVHLKEGNTFFIPPGWIHGVYTPEDSIVFGGNYLHTYGGRIQLRIWKLEENTHVKMKFRYPFYKELHWYVMARYVQSLMDKNYVVELKKEPEPDDDSSAKKKDEKMEESEKEEAKEEKVETVEPKPEIEDELKEEEPKPVIGEKIISSLQRAMQVTREIQLKTEALGNQKSEDWIHLTKYEVENLQAIVSWLRKIPPADRCLPEDVKDADNLLKDAQLLVNLHRRDDFFGKAITGETVLQGKKAKTTARSSAKLPREPKPRSAPKTEGGPLRRRIRCQNCEPCRRSNCRECVFCLDMVKHGGPGVMRKPCIQKGCITPQLPSNVICDICLRMDRRNSRQRESNEYDPTFDLFECGICWSIVHPRCLYIKSKEDGLDISNVEGVPCSDLPNYWECPKCVLAGKQGNSRPRVPRGLHILKTFENDPMEGSSSCTVRLHSKRNASRDAFERLMSMTPQMTVGRPRKHKIQESYKMDHSYCSLEQPSSAASSAAPTSIVVNSTPIVKSPPQNEYSSSASSSNPYQFLLADGMGDYIDHEEVIGGSDLSRENSASSSIKALPVSPSKVFIVPTSEIYERFEDAFVPRTSSRGEVQRPKRFIEEG